VFDPNDFRNKKEQPEESTISHVNTIVPPAEGTLIHPDKIRDPKEGRGCFLNCLYIAIIGILVMGIVSVLLIAFPNTWLPPIASLIVPEYKYPSFYSEPNIGDTETVAETSTAIPISHHDLVLHTPFERHTSSEYNEEANAIEYGFPDGTVLTMQRGQPQNLDPTGTINLSILKIEPQLFEVTFSDLNSCENLEDCLTYFALIVTKKMVLDTQPGRDSSHTIASGTWSKYSTETATIYQMDTVFSEDGTSQTVTFFVIPNENGGGSPYTVPSLKELMATYAASSDPDDTPAVTDQDVYSVTLTAPDIRKRDIDTIASSITLSEDSQ
jgi:hypothetical protein